MLSASAILGGILLAGLAVAAYRLLSLADRAFRRADGDRPLPAGRQMRLRRRRPGEARPHTTP